MNRLPEPLTPADSDLSDFGFMPLDVVRLRNSDLVALSEPEAIVAALLLWGVAWHSKPAASLTDDDRVLAQAAGYGRAVDAFLRVKAEALRGFVKCADGRLYHPIVAEKAVEAWQGKLRQRHRTFLATLRKHNERDREAGGNDQRAALSFDDWNDAGRPEKVTRDIGGLSRVTKQPELDLSADSRAPASAHAREQGSGQTDENNQIGNVTLPDANVTRDKAECHAPVTRETASKGEGEGQGQGDSIKNLPSTPRHARKVEEDRNDLLGLTNRLARLGGVSIINPSSIARATDIVKAWIADGLDVERDIVPIIEKAVQDAPPGGVASLGYFDRPIRTALARKAGAKRTPAKAAKPLAKLSATDDDDPGVKAFRDALPAQVGARSAETWLSPDRCAITLNGTSVVLKVVDSFHRQWIEANLADHLTRIAHLAGKSRVKVEIAA